MKKNLKKVISAVISLAIAGGLVPASLAAKVTLTDVADTASYATAVNTLVALNVINGYEDGTFLPDNLITRAEVTKVVVAALNMLDSAEGMSGSTQFTDMDESSAWANGYVNAGVQQGFINGMGDGTFAPKANVTYAQIVKMLVSSLGYDEYAEFMGGYPNGYLQIANSEGVTNGVKASANDNVTRAQVAQLVYNFLKTPIVEKTGMEYSSNGTLVPTLAKMDGNNDNNYKTILTQNFDAYFVEGYVTDTHKSNTGLDADQISFGIAKSEKYDNDDFYLSKTVTGSFDDFKNGTVGNLLTPVYVGDTDAADYLGVYASAIIMVDEYDDFRLISFEPSGKNKTVKFDASLLDTDDYKEDTNGDYTLENTIPTYLKFFATESASKSTKYNLKDVKLYVNGYEVDLGTTSNKVENLEKYVINNTVGEIELVDTYKTDGYYDAIYVSYYETAQVDTVMTSSKKVMFNKYTKGASSYLTLDEDANDKLVYNIYYNGEKVTLAELKKDDILSIAFDVNSGFKSSNVYDIYVSRNVQSGKLTGRNEADEIVTIGGTQYKFVETFPSNDKMKLSDEFTVYVDYFGRIFDYETDAVNAKYALIDKFIYSTSEENYRATIFTTDGTTKTYTFDAGKAEVIIDGVTVAKSSDSKEKTKKAAFEAVYTNEYKGNNAGSTKKPAEKRVIKYKVSSSTGNMTSIEFLTAGATSISGTTAEGDKILNSYKERTNAIGSVKLSSATKVIDGIEYLNNEYDQISDLAMATVDSLVDDTPYEAYGYGDKLSDGTYPIVLVLVGEGAYNATSRFAVVTGAPESGVDEAGDDIYTIPAFYKGEETSIIANEDMESALDLEKGDVFMFLTDSNGYAKQIDVIFAMGDYSSYDKLVAASIVEDNDTNSLVTYPSKDDLSDDFDKAWNSSKSEPIQIVMGPVMAKENSYFSIGKITNGTVGDYTGLYTDITKDEKEDGGIYDISTTDATTVYTYDYSKSTSGTNRFEIGRASSIVKSVFGSANTINDGDIIPWNFKAEDKTTPNLDTVSFALALVVDGTAVDVFAFIAE
ncbi:MAG: S-layer homology domain-containing protein [Clostridia bacterium]|nr:S-layer homology domain-containing protein [Clostridia bacterium]